ncbi:alpha-amylase family glycosyl hydrolase [Pelodictyon luteolum]|uniref:Alpha amylase, catalytic subdomain n=1 Tax=Chlorobium luteolum (strain DSM 273 / BCRC 81028 / 2530) TaxID=319225 RepID=Q3B5P1_CHLL3|nr:alpha-amylase family glycosyl hydrolase [Pelodictyon luteolum]ABB23340.1 Alpha amylase, catalytic subdomain [Pelodictyon luteolum DSM 273]
MFPLVYEINTRIWLQKLGRLNNRPVTLGNVPDSEFRFFSESGFDMVWLMGVWKPSEYSRAIATSHPDLRASLLEHLPSLQPADIASSPYSIPSYTVNEALGGHDELLLFREKLAHYGIRLMLDFVPNHLALDNQWLPAHPEFFISVSQAERSHDPGSSFEYAQGKYLAYSRDPYFPSWTDTLQINYANPATHAMMTGNLLKISELCDAVRCDVAMLVLKSVFNTTWKNLSGHMKDEFWGPAIAAVKARHPKFTFLAESYWNKEWELQQQGFDFTYDKPFYDYLASAPVNVEKLKGHMQAQWSYQQHLCRFIENHDEPRAADKMGLNNRAAALCCLMAPGMHLVHQDQMDGYRHKIPVQLIHQAPEHADRDLGDLYRKLFILQRDPAFQEGQIEWLDLQGSNHTHCIGFHRFTPERHAFVLANFGSTGIAFDVTHPVLEQVERSQIGVLSTAHGNRTAAPHLSGQVIQVRLAPHEAVAITF